MRKRILLVAAALVLVFATMVAPLAHAAGTTDATALATTKADVSTDGITLSADTDNKTAVLDGCAFAVGDFQRASKGSNRNIGDAYYGYAYALGEKPDTLMYMATDDLVIVYVDPSAASAAGMSGLDRAWCSGSKGSRSFSRCSRTGSTATRRYAAVRPERHGTAPARPIAGT